jgi:hypothetical protein
MREKREMEKDNATHFPFSWIKIKRQTTTAAAAAAKSVGYTR